MIMKVMSRLPPRGEKERSCVPDPCNNCDQVHTWESKRTLKVHMTEHKLVVETSDPNNGIAVQCCEESVQC